MNKKNNKDEYEPIEYKIDKSIKNQNTKTVAKKSFVLSLFYMLLFIFLSIVSFTFYIKSNKLEKQNSNLKELLINQESIIIRIQDSNNQIIQEINDKGLFKDKYSKERIKALKALTDSINKDISKYKRNELIQMSKE